MAQYIDKAVLVAEIEKLKGQLLKGACSSQINMVTSCKEEAYNEVLSFIDTIESKEMDLEKTKWSPSKKQIESLGALVRYNIGVFDYQKLNEVAILYDDLTKILDYETDRQK